MLTDEQVAKIENRSAGPWRPAGPARLLAGDVADLIADRSELVAELNGYRNGALDTEAKIRHLERAITCGGGSAGCLNMDHECWTCFSDRLSGALLGLAETAETCIRYNGIVDDVLEEAIATARKVLT